MNDGCEYKCAHKNEQRMYKGDVERFRNSVSFEGYEQNSVITEPSVLHTYNCRASRKSSPMLEEKRSKAEDMERTQLVTPYPVNDYCRLSLIFFLKNIEAATARLSIPGPE